MSLPLKRLLGYPIYPIKNSLNLISKNASSVGSYDLNLFSDDEGKNKVLDEINNGNIELLFLFGQDNLKLNKKKIL